MKLLDEAQLNQDRAAIQLLHSRLGLDLARCMAYHTGNFWHIAFLDQKNQLVGKYLELLSLFDIKGDTTANEYYNVLTMDDIGYIIDTTLIADGEGFVRWEACDINGLCSVGFSQNITIDNTAPGLIVVSPLSYQNVIPLWMNRQA